MRPAAAWKSTEPRKGETCLLSALVYLRYRCPAINAYSSFTTGRPCLDTSKTAESPQSLARNPNHRLTSRATSGSRPRIGLRGLGESQIALQQTAITIFKTTHKGRRKHESKGQGDLDGSTVIRMVNP